MQIALQESLQAWDTLKTMTPLTLLKPRCGGQHYMQIAMSLYNAVTCANSSNLDNDQLFLSIQSHHSIPSNVAELTPLGITTVKAGKQMDCYCN